METAVARSAPIFLPRTDRQTKWPALADARFVGLVAVLLAILHVALAVTASIEKSPTYDEPTHLTAGYSYWLRNDFRLDPENGNFPQRWAALPLLLSRPNFPSTETVSWKQAAVGETSQQFFYRSGNDSDQMLLHGRIMIALLSGALSLLIFFCSKQFFGTIGGLISESIAVFDPNLLAHGALITSDAASAFLFSAAIWSYWRLLHCVSARWFVLTGLSVAGLFLAKMSSPFFLFMVGIFSAIHIFSRSSMTIRIAGIEQGLTEKWRKTIAVIGLASVIGAIVVLTIWASFSFRSAAFTEIGRARELWNARWDYLLAEHTPTEDIIEFARAHRLFPEAYLYGFAYAHNHLIDRPAFLDGRWSNVGFHSFFLRAFAYKTSLPVLLLLAMSALAACLHWKQAASRSSISARRIICRDLLRLTPIWTLTLVYGALAFATRLNIGHRHLLPIYPSLFIVCGACGYFYQQKRTKLATGFVAALLVWHVGESFAVRPDYLAYFNEVAGGPANGYKHLVDSSLDWGQDLPPLKGWLDQHKNEAADGQLYLAYFGTGDTTWYGIHAIRLPENEDNATPSPLGSGLYCISATTLQHVYAVEQGTWAQPYENAYQAVLIKIQRADRSHKESPRTEIETFDRLRFARLCAYLRHQEPIAKIGYSILIFRMTEYDLRAALYAPPPELAPGIEVQTE